MVGSVADVEPLKRDEVLTCAVAVENSYIPAVLGLRCVDADSHPVATIYGASCRSCFAGVVFSIRANLVAASRSLVKQLIDHLSLTERIYAPQLKRSEDR